ncbi:hypothetical protein Tco_0988099 [Tanacetum coccineum]|uniref:Transposase n=1 Tax=Tanacetum coccineum TaxID=301880 RepID=A0ABQ5EQ77_9ASTR
MAWMGRNADIKDGDSVNLSLQMLYSAAYRMLGVLHCVSTQGEPEIGKTENKMGIGPKQKRMHWGNIPDSDIKCYWECTNDNERINLTWDNLSVNNWIKIRYGKVCKITRDRILMAHWKERFGKEDDDTDEGWEDTEKYGEEIIDAILDTVLDKLDDSSFSGTTEYEDDLDGITDYLEPTSYDGFINSKDEAYKERLCNFPGMPYRRPPLILIEKVEVTRYNIGPGKTYTKTKILGINKIPRTSTNVATVRAVLMDEMGARDSAQGAT